MLYNKEYKKGDGRILVAGGPRDLQRRQHASGEGFIVEELHAIIKDLKEQLSKKPTVEGAFSAEEVDDSIRKAVEQTVKEMEASNDKVVTDLHNLKASLKREIADLKEKEKALMGTIEANNKLHKEELVATIKEESEKYKRIIEQIDEGYNLTIKQIRESLVMSEEKNKAKDDIISLLKENIEAFKAGDLGRPDFDRFEKLLMSLAEGQEVVDPSRPTIESIFIDPLEKNAGEGLESHIVINEETSAENNKEKVDSQLSKLKKIMRGLPND